MPGWYMAVLVRGTFVEGELDRKGLGDLLYRLLRASDAETAYARAMALGATLTDTYEEEGQIRTLRFLGLADLSELETDELADGVEVYNELLSEPPLERVADKTRLRVFESDEAPAGDEDDFGTEPDRISLPGNDAIEPH